MSRIRVVVTAEDIAKGRPTAERCPLARAIRRATKARPVAVFNESYMAGEGRPEYPLPIQATVFVESYDRRSWGFVTDEPPLTFYLEGPDR